MKASVVPIGNSKGIRIPKTVLEECKIEDEVVLEIEGETILIKPVKHKPRKNWEKAFRKMHEQDEDSLILDDLLDLNTLGWEW
jgi:antitoxin MazE